MEALQGHVVYDTPGSIARHHVYASRQCSACGLCEGTGDPLHNMKMTMKAWLHLACTCQFQAVGTVMCSWCVHAVLWAACPLGLLVRMREPALQARRMPH